jgi:hypothetical protein
MRGEIRLLLSVVSFLILIPGVALSQPEGSSAKEKGKPRKNDFEIIRVPKGKKPICTPIFFCRTSAPKAKAAADANARKKKPFTKKKQVNWCVKYASEILKRKVEPSQLLLVQIEPSVDLSRLKQLSIELKKLAKCKGSWPPNQPVKLSTLFNRDSRKQVDAMSNGKLRSEDGAAGVLEGPAADDSSGRGIVLIQPDPAIGAEKAALLGPDYSDNDFVTSVDSIPSEGECPSELEWWERVPPD